VRASDELRLLVKRNAVHEADQLLDHEVDNVVCFL
jgi:hypothetical protein